MLYRMDTAAIVDELARLVAAHYVFADVGRGDRPGADPPDGGGPVRGRRRRSLRSEEHTSELQSHLNLVCRLLLEKKKTSLQPLYAERHALITIEIHSRAYSFPR